MAYTFPITIETKYAPPVAQVRLVTFKRINTDGMIEQSIQLNEISHLPSSPNKCMQPERQWPKIVTDGCYPIQRQSITRSSSLTVIDLKRTSIMIISSLVTIQTKKRGKNTKLSPITNPITNTENTYIYSNQRTQNGVSRTPPVNFPTTSNPTEYNRMETLYTWEDIQRINQHHDKLLSNINSNQTTIHRHRVDKSRCQIHARNPRQRMEILLRIKFPT